MERRTKIQKRAILGHLFSTVAFGISVRFFFLLHRVEEIYYKYTFGIMAALEYVDSLMDCRELIMPG